MEKFNFEHEFSSEEEVVRAIDEALLSLANDVDADEGRTAILNIAKQKEIGIAYAGMKYALKGTRAKVTYRLHEPYQSMGVVSVTGKDLTFMQGSVFANVAQLASNTDIYSKEDGSVQIDLTFYGLTIPIE